ncbi:MAG: hypothetical protein N3A38_03105 [Planctomycetota bacterium]|nr:hypothetical protein [Planctomycetota bacterium]
MVLKDATYEKWGTLSGGMTMLVESAGEADLVAYHGWRKIEGFEDIGVEKTLDALENLRRFLDGVNSERASLGMPPLVLSGRGERYIHRTFEELQRPGTQLHPRRQVFEQMGGIYRAVEQILDALPRPHMFNPHIREIMLGEGVSSSVRGSEYVPEQGQVVMFTLALGAARRTFVGLFLHELGHAMARRMLEDDSEAGFFEERHGFLRATGAFLGVDFWIGREDRVFYQTDIEEFLAETFMHYVAAGDCLRAHIASFGDGKIARCWTEVYEAFRDRYFSGIEYSCQT